MQVILAHLPGLGIMPALLQEIVSVYPLLSPPNLTAHVSNRVCNALALLQCVASHPDTRQLFLNGKLRMPPEMKERNSHFTRQPIYHYSYTHSSTPHPRHAPLSISALLPLV